MKIFFRSLIVGFFLLSHGSYSQNLRALGKKIINDSGDEVILKGVGLGGWMLQEGYMMNSSGAADTQHEFIEKLNLLIGEQETNKFYEDWRSNFVTKRDIDSIANWGFNSVRLAMHYNLFTKPIEDEPVEGENTWLTTGFDMVDELLNWCEENQIYLILDLHAAPGGQGQDAAISDYDSDKPSLWESEFNKSKTVALWGKLAERYKDEKWIGGYDLINEPNWPMDGSVLRDLYVRITNEIRNHDQNHIIFIEGNWFANDFSGLTPPWDSNMVYSFHKYWTYNDTASIQWVLDMRNQHNIPLWMGESGENSNTWYTDAVKLFKSNNIGWSWWPWKRIATTVSPFSVKSNENYETIIKYWKGEVAKPSTADAIAGLTQLTSDLLVVNNDYFKDVVDALLRQPENDTHIPYSTNSIPGVLYFSNFDLGANEIAYYDVDNANYSLSTNSFQAWNSGWSLRNDGVDIQSNSDNTNSNGYHVAWTQKGEWMKYSVEIAETAYYDFSFRYATEQSGGKVKFMINDVDVSGSITLGNTGGWSNFVFHNGEDLYLEAGSHVLKVLIESTASFNLSSVAFTKSNDASDTFEVLSANTFDDEKSLQIVFNLPANDVTVSKDFFDVRVNDQVVEIESVEIDSTSKRFVKIILKDYIFYQDQIRVDYDGTVIKSINNETLSTFNNLSVENQLATREYIPGKIQAEDFINQVGLDVESTTDSGGGENIGYTDQGDYADYKIFVSEDGNYQLDLRIAALDTSGAIDFDLISENSTENLTSINIPITGGWQSWQTTSSPVVLYKGIYTLRMKVQKSGFNLNWFEFKFSSSLSVDDFEQNRLAIFPNPIDDYFSIKTSNTLEVKLIDVYDVLGRRVRRIDPIENRNIYNLSDIKPGPYFLVIETDLGRMKRKIINR